jgi:hypothetical protein
VLVVVNVDGCTFERRVNDFGEIDDRFEVGD